MAPLIPALAAVRATPTLLLLRVGPDRVASPPAAEVLRRACAAADSRFDRAMRLAVARAPRKPYVPREHGPA